MKKYQIIYADPPWRYEHPPIGSKGRAIERHYPTLPLASIKELPIPSEDNAVLFLWATAPKLKECIDVMIAWGFEYRTCMVWDKVKIGMGYWCRNQHELLLIGLRGQFSPPPPEQRVSSIYKEARKEHSAKPRHFRDLIANWYPDASKVELFARPNSQLDMWGGYTFDGWDCWGNEVKSDIEL